LIGSLTPSQILKSNIKNVDLFIHFSYLFFLSLLTFPILNIYFSFLILILISSFVEFIQSIIPFRKFSINDFFSDLFGIIFAFLIYKFFIKKEKNVYLVFSSLMGIGFIKGGGTIASIISILLFYIFKPSIFTILILIFLTISFAIHFRKFLKFEKDPSYFVFDEFSGMFIILPFLNFNIFLTMISFILYRIFDIIKPFGIKKIENIKILGIILDDYAGSFLTVLIILIIKFLSRLVLHLPHPLYFLQHIFLNSS
jgi:phosphatidylglycerophosphatase A